MHTLGKCSQRETPSPLPTTTVTLMNYHNHSNKVKNWEFFKKHTFLIGTLSCIKILFSTPFEPEGEEEEPPGCFPPRRFLLLPRVTIPVVSCLYSFAVGGQGLVGEETDLQELKKKIKKNWEGGEGKKWVKKTHLDCARGRGGGISSFLALRDCTETQRRSDWWIKNTDKKKKQETEKWFTCKRRALSAALCALPLPEVPLVSFVGDHDCIVATELTESLRKQECEKYFEAKRSSVCFDI